MERILLIESPQNAFWKKEAKLWRELDEPSAHHIKAGQSDLFNASLTRRPKKNQTKQKTYATEGTGSKRGAAPPLLTGLHGPGSMAARSFFPADRPSDELSLLASFLGVLPAE